MHSRHIASFGWSPPSSGDFIMNSHSFFRLRAQKEEPKRQPYRLLCLCLPSSDSLLVLLLHCKAQFFFPPLASRLYLFSLRQHPPPPTTILCFILLHVVARCRFVMIPCAAGNNGCSRRRRWRKNILQGRRRRELIVEDGVDLFCMDFRLPKERNLCLLGTNCYERERKALEARNHIIVPREKGAEKMSRLGEDTRNDKIMRACNNMLAPARAISDSALPPIQLRFMAG